MNDRKNLSDWNRTHTFEWFLVSEVSFCLLSSEVDLRIVCRDVAMDLRVVWPDLDDVRLRLDLNQDLLLEVSCIGKAVHTDDMDTVN